jgi:hypothetical protein
MPLMPMRLSASRTSSSLNGLMIAMISFMTGCPHVGSRRSQTTAAAEVVATSQPGARHASCVITGFRGG